MGPSERQLAAMQVEANKYLTDTCTIRRTTLVPDEAGGTTETYVDRAGVACRLASTGGSEGKVAERMSLVTPWTVTLPAGTDITAEDCILMDGRTLEAAVVVTRPWEITRRVLCTEVSG